MPREKQSERQWPRSITTDYYEFCIKQMCSEPHVRVRVHEGDSKYDRFLEIFVWRASIRDGVLFGDRGGALKQEHPALIAGALGGLQPAIIREVLSRSWRGIKRAGTICPVRRSDFLGRKSFIVRGRV
jgi:hypothetical protein